MNDFERMLERDLADAADRIDTRPTQVGIILTAGAERARRRTMRRTLGGVVATGALAVGSITWLSGGDGGVVRAGADESPGASIDGVAPNAAPEVVDAGGAGSQLVSSELTWRSVEVDSAEALGSFVFGVAGEGGDGPYYAVSTEPGRSDSSRPVLWRSDDGLSWTVGGAAPSYGVALAQSGSAVYAVGTAPSVADAPRGIGGDPVVSSTDDGGVTWTDLPIPLDVAAIEDAPGVGNVTVQSVITDGPAGVVLALQPFAYPDLSVVPGYSDQFGYQTYPDGVGLWAEGGSVPCQELEGVASTAPAAVAPSVVGVDESATTAPVVDSTVMCTTEVEEGARYTWVELGIADDLVPYLSGQRVMLHRLTEDGGVEALAPIEFGPGHVVGITGLTSTEAGYVLSGYTTGAAPTYPTTSFVMTSPDGTAWTRHDLPVNGWVNAPVVWAGGLAILQQTEDGGYLLLRSVTGEEWTTTDLGQLLNEAVPNSPFPAQGWMNQLVAGPSGLTVLAGYNQPIDPATLPDGTPNTVPPVDTAPAITEPADGEMTATTITEFAEMPPTSWVVFHSSDGVAWSADSLPELTDLSPAVGVGLRVAGAKTVVSITDLGGRTGDDLPRSTLLVGTPNG